MIQGLDSPGLEERFWSKVAIPADVLSGCWKWTGATNDREYNYGCFWTIGKLEGAHRVALALTGTEVPPGRVVDHLCRNPNCVNPGHLEIVTQSENTKRGIAGIRRTHCVRGHALTDENTYVTPKSKNRMCKTCKRWSNLARYNGPNGEQARAALAGEKKP